MDNKVIDNLSNDSDSSDFDGLPNKELEMIWDIVLKEFPELSQLGIEKLMPTQEDFLSYTAGEFVSSDASREPLIRMAQGDIKHLDSLKVSRSAAVEIMANKLGVAFENIDAKILNLLIFLHEVGHGKDYISNYRGNAAYSSREDADNEWHKHFEHQLKSLPVPGLDPTDLRLMLKELGGWQAFKAHYTNLNSVFNKYNIQNEEDLLRVQEVEYRNLPHESYADDFASKVLKEHWGTIGLEPSLLNNFPSLIP